MLIYLYGPDTYRRSKKLKEILTQYEAKHSGLAVHHFDIDEKDTQALCAEFIIDQSLFSTTKLGIVHTKGKNKEEAELFKSVLNDTETTLIIVSDKKLTTGYSFLNKKPTLSQEFKLLKTTDLYTFIKKEANEKKIALTPELLRSLSELFGSDTWGIVTELEKIALGGTLKTYQSTPDFFSLVQRFSKGPARARFIALAYLLETQDPVATFNITAALADKDLKIKMADLDVAIKSGKLEYPEALALIATSPMV